MQHSVCYSVFNSVCEDATTPHQPQTHILTQIHTFNAMAGSFDLLTSQNTLQLFKVSIQASFFNLPLKCAFTSHFHKVWRWTFRKKKKSFLSKCHITISSNVGIWLLPPLALLGTILTGNKELNTSTASEQMRIFWELIITYLEES